MARSRNIKPGFFKNYDLADCGPICQVLFAGLWCLADREGRLEDKPRFIKAEIFPYYDCDINGELTKLERLGFVRRYSGDGKGVIEIVAFKKHQSPHNTEKASELPSYEVRDDVSPCSITEHEINGSLTVDSRKYNDGNRPDSLIPDSLIPDSLIPDSLIPDCGLTDTPPAKKPRAARVTALSCSDLLEDGLTEDTANEWLAFRRQKRAPLTATAWAGIKREAAKAGWSMQDVVTKCMARGWQGFEADWVRGGQSSGHGEQPNKQEALEARNQQIAARWVERMQREGQA